MRCPTSALVQWPKKFVLPSWNVLLDWLIFLGVGEWLPWSWLRWWFAHVVLDLGHPVFLCLDCWWVVGMQLYLLEKYCSTLGWAGLCQIVCVCLCSDVECFQKCAAFQNLDELVFARLFCVCALWCFLVCFQILCRIVDGKPDVHIKLVFTFILFQIVFLLLIVCVWKWTHERDLCGQELDWRESKCSLELVFLYFPCVLAHVSSPT